MKLSEFQEKLTTVSDSKLRLMLADSQRKGPEVAVKLILAEAERRGVDLNAVPMPAAPSEAALGPEAGISAESAGSADGVAEDGEGMPASEAHGAGIPDASPAGKGAWLAEEANQGMPMIVKLLITAVILGGILFGLFLLLGKQ